MEELLLSQEKLDYCYLFLKVYIIFGWIFFREKLQRINKIIKGDEGGVKEEVAFYILFGIGVCIYYIRYQRREVIGSRFFFRFFSIFLSEQVGRSILGKGRIIGIICCLVYGFWQRQLGLFFKGSSGVQRLILEVVKIKEVKYQEGSWGCVEGWRSVEESVFCVIDFFLVFKVDYIQIIVSGLV